MNTIMIYLNNLYKNYTKLGRKIPFFNSIKNWYYSNKIRKELDNIIFGNDIFDLSEVALSLMLSSRDYITDNRLALNSSTVFSITTPIGEVIYNNRTHSFTFNGRATLFMVDKNSRISSKLYKEYEEYVAELRFIYRDIINYAECALVQSEVDPYDTGCKLYNKVRRLIDERD